MKVYVLFWKNWNTEWVEFWGVFSSKELAEERIEECPDFAIDDRFTIEEHMLDD